VTSLTLPRPSGRGTRGNRILRFLNDLAGSFHEGLELARRYDILAAKSDAQLARLGLRREDVPRAALLGRKR
jgi:uncharacterized protein YjiS (DUF1127 family)